MMDPILAENLDWWTRPFPAQLTAKSGSSPILYSWTELICDGSTGNYVTALPARSGDATINSAREINNKDVDVSGTPTVWMRVRGTNGSDYVYEFEAGVQPVTVTDGTNTATGNTITVAPGPGSTGAVIVSAGPTITLQDASASNSGIVNLSSQSFAGLKRFGGGVSVEGLLRLQPQSITITGTTDPMATPTLPTVWLTGAATPVLKGITAPSPATYQAFWAVNVGSVSIPVQHAVAGTAANDIFCPGSTSTTLPPGWSAFVEYDTIVSAWRWTLGSFVGNGGTVSTLTLTDPTINITTGDTWTISSGQTLTITGGTVIYDSTIEVAGIWWWDWATVINLANGNNDNLTNPGKAVQPVNPGVNANARIVGFVAPSPSGNQFFKLINTGTLPVFVDDSASGTGANTIKTPGAVTATIAPAEQMDFLYNTGSTCWEATGGTPATTKGDLVGFDGTKPNRLPVGANGTVLTADSTQSDGVKWATASSTTGTNGSSDITSAYTLTVSYAATGLSVTLPNAGTYLVIASVSAIVSTSGAVDFEVDAQLWDSTASAQVGDAQVILQATTSGAVAFMRGSGTVIARVVTAGTNHVIQVRGMISTLTNISNAVINGAASGNAPSSSIIYVQIA